MIAKAVFIFFIFPFLLMSEKYSVDLQEFGKIEYYFEEKVCKKIVRLSTSDEVRYEHLYHYDSDNKLISESLIGNLGEIVYLTNTEDLCFLTKTPFGEEKWSKEDKTTFQESNTEKVYDREGRLIQKGKSSFYYEGEKLVQVSKDQKNIFFGYSKDGKKIYKQIISESEEEEEEHYIYLGNHEIGSVSDKGILKWLRIPGVSPHPDLVRAIAIETNGAVYAPIYDHQWNIIKLINIENKKIIETRPDPFGENLAEISGCPWTFCSKRFDPDTNLVDFGYRYYDIDLKEWTSLDPLKQDSNPYRYCFNNPLQFLDPDGRAAFVIPILTWTGGALTFPLWGPEALAILIGASTVYFSCEAYEYWQDYSNKKMEQSEQDRKKAGDLQRQVEKGQAPDSVDRVDKGLGPHEKDHVHFKDDHALNHDGSWKHGGRNIRNKEKKWLQDNGWKLPEA